MKELIFLKTLDVFSFVFKWTGFNYSVMRMVVQLKIINDKRRAPTILSNANRKKDLDNNQFYTSLLFYLFYGLILLIIFFSPGPLFFRMALSLGAMILLLITIMISDYSSVLLDIKDRNILLPKPVDSRVLNIAKIIHIFYYLSMISLTLSGPTLIAGFATNGVIFLFIFVPVLIMILFLCIFVTSLLYGLILRFFDGEKLKNLINYVQIVISIFIPIAYQFTGEMFEIFQQQIVFTPRWWAYLLPSIWFAAPFELFIEHNWTTTNINLSILAFLIPTTGLYIFIKIITPYFEKNLVKLIEASPQNTRVQLKEKISRKLVDLITITRTENACYRFMKNMVSRERRLKLSIYPSLGLSFIFPFIILKNEIDFNSLRESIQKLSEGNYYLLVYWAVVFMPSIITLLGYSEYYKGSWIYRVLPIRDFALLKRTRVKIFFFKYILPLFSLHCILFSLLFGAKLIPDFGLIITNCLLLILALTAGEKDLPFSLEFGTQHNKGNKVKYTFLSFLFGGLLAGLHILLKLIPYGILINIVVNISIIYFIWKKYFYS